MANPFIEITKGNNAGRTSCNWGLLLFDFKADFLNQNILFPISHLPVLANRSLHEQTAFPAFHLITLLAQNSSFSPNGRVVFSDLFSSLYSRSIYTPLSYSVLDR